MGGGELGSFKLYPKIFLLVLAMVLPTKPAIAGAWSTGRGRGQVISTSLFDRAVRGFDESGVLGRAVDFTKWEENFFLEYGLADHTTLVAQTVWQDLTYSTSGQQADFSGFGESYLGVRQLVWQDKKTVLSGQMGVFLAGGGEVIADADLGFGDASLEMRGLLGRSVKFSGRDGFAELQIARRLRQKPFPNEWRAEASAGLDISPNLQIMGQGFYAKVKTRGQNLPTSIRDNERLKLQASLVVRRSAKTSWQFGAFETVRGKSIIRERGGFFAVWTRF